jgi:putative tricarboxylic transport membrane protein
MNAEARSPSTMARYAELAVALAVIALGVLILVETRDIRLTRATARVGPRVIPTIVGVGQIVVGIWYAIEVVVFRHPAPVEADAEDMDPDAPTDWRTLALLGGALIAYASLIERAGFVIASAVLFVIAALAMGSRRYVRDIACGSVLGIVAFLIFDQWLGVRLPEGWLGGLW